MTNLETIRAACIKANPSIMELGFGCEVKKQNIDFICVGLMPSGELVTVKKEGVYDYTKPRGENVEVFDEGKTEILGRPIRLSDILWALGDGKEMTREERERAVMHTYYNWNLLKDDLREQSDETLSFLAELLK